MEKLEKITLSAPDGAHAEVYLHGAQVTSWVPAGGSECLFLSAASEFRPGAAIRGGVPIIFPQFGMAGSLPKHGFARNLLWDLEEVALQGATVSARLIQRESLASRRIWDYPYTLSLTIELGGPRLSLRLDVTNSGVQPFAFTGALHTYLRVDDLTVTGLSGLSGRPFIDTVGGENRPDVQNESFLGFTTETDRIYPAAPSPLRLQDATHQVEIASQGFPDCVVWNPGSILGSKLADLEPEGYKRFVCVEAALAVRPMLLLPGETWRGVQKLQILEA
jgi:glucose-6-phosphate 1-epimerase